MSNKTGLSFGGLLTLLFIGLKLSGIIDWAWIWVLSPLWIPLGILAIVGIIYLIIVYGKKCVKRIPCLFKGHDYQGKYERTELTYGYCDKYVVRCKRCGKIQ